MDSAPITPPAENLPADLPDAAPEAPAPAHDLPSEAISPVPVLALVRVSSSSRRFRKDPHVDGRGKHAKAWKKGQSGNPKGRPAGLPNKVTVEARAAAGQLVDDPIYRANLLKRLRAGKLAPQVEAMFWGYAKGKVPDRLEVGHAGDFSDPAVPIAALKARALELLSKIDDEGDA